MARVFGALHAGGVDIVLSGHDHIYEQFAPIGGGPPRDAGRGTCHR